MSERRRWWIVLGVVAVAAAVGGPPATAGPSEDAYLRGYAAAVLERELRIGARGLRVADGVVTVPAADLGGVSPARVVAVLSAVPGVAQVRILEGAADTRAPGVAAPAAAPAGPLERFGILAERPLRQSADLPTGFLPPGLLFDPLLADPRWPNFSASYHHYLGDRDFTNVSAVSFGETFPIYRGRAWLDTQWEVGLQAGVFASFDLDGESFDLINADYFVAAPLSVRRGPLSGLLRFAHQSSHLGDEFLLREGIRRRNLSFETVDLKLSYDLLDGAVRLYAGPGYVFDTGEESVDGWTAQYGLELLSPWALRRPNVRPVFAADVQHREHLGWGADVSLRGGLQFESVQVLGRKLLILLEYFNGHSPNGQFFERRIEYVGVGAHFYH